MIKDFQQHKTLRDNYDFCIIGAGPAGITLGLRLAAAGWNVLLAEGGGREYAPHSQGLYACASTGLELYAEETRLRYLGAPPTTGPAVAGLSPRRILPSPRQVTCPVGRFPIRRSKATCRRPWTSSTCQPARIFVR